MLSLFCVDAWNERELILHNLVHIAQCERSGGLEQWVREYLGRPHHLSEFHHWLARRRSASHHARNRSIAGV